MALFKSTVVDKNSPNKPQKTVYWMVQIGVKHGKLTNATKAVQISKKQYDEWVKKYGKKR